MTRDPFTTDLTARPASRWRLDAVADESSRVHAFSASMNTVRARICDLGFAMLTGCEKICGSRFPQMVIFLGFLRVLLSGPFYGGSELDRHKMYGGSSKGGHQARQDAYFFANPMNRVYILTRDRAPIWYDRTSKRMSQARSTLRVKPRGAEMT